MMADAAKDPRLEALAVLMTAAEQGRTDIVKMVAEGKKVSLSAPRKGIEGMPDDGKTALHVAAERGNVDVVRALLKEGVDVGARDGAGQQPCSVASPACLQAIEMELFQRVALGDSPGVRQLLCDTGLSHSCSDGSATGDRPLHWASSFGNAEMVATLLECGADLDAPNAEGATPLHEAASKNAVGCLEALLEGGAAAGVAGHKGYSKDKTALAVAELNGHAAAAAALQGTDGDDAHRAQQPSPPPLSPALPPQQTTQPAPATAAPASTAEEKDQLIARLRDSLDSMLEDQTMAAALKAAQAMPLLNKLRDLRAEKSELQESASEQQRQLARCQAELALARQELSDAKAKAAALEGGARFRLVPDHASLRDVALELVFAGDISQQKQAKLVDLARASLLPNFGTVSVAKPTEASAQEARETKAASQARLRAVHDAALEMMAGRSARASPPLQHAVPVEHLDDGSFASSFWKFCRAL